MASFAEWESFYVIVGAAAGALIGLQFVIMALIAERPSLRSAQAGPAFTTPTVVHFSTALLLSALVRVPWHSVEPAAALWGFVGVAGVVYTAVVIRRVRRAQAAYKADVEDWIFHVGLPFAAYALLVISALAARWREEEAAFGVGTAALLLLFIGIHNAWDAVAYYVFVQRSKPDPERRE
jgi:hypothetical protein